MNAPRQNVILAHPVVFIALGARKSTVVCLDRAHLARYVARKAREGFSVLDIRPAEVADMSGLIAYRVQIAPHVIATEDYTPGAQWYHEVTRDGVRYGVQGWTAPNGDPMTAWRELMPPSDAPAWVLDRIPALASPCTLDPREVSSFGDTWALAYRNALRRGESVESADRRAWALLRLDMSAYFEGCDTVPDWTRAPIHEGASIDTAEGRKACRADLRGRTLAEVIQAGILAEIDAEVIHDGADTVATVSDMNPYTIRTEGARAWSDVLALRVVGVGTCDGTPCVAIGDRNAPDAERMARRVQKFTLAYAGYISEELYDAWFNLDGPQGVSQ